MTPPSTNFSELVSELNVAQHDLWLQANGCVLSLYFDTADVRRALLGASEYISWENSETMVVNTKDFEKREVLVDSLLAAMFLGPFSMLPPHQAELLRQLKSDEAFNRVPRKIDQTSFLQQIGIDSRWGSDISDRVNESTLKETIERHVGAETERFFKAIQCIRMPWWERLRKLTRDQVFKQCEAEFSYQSLIKHKDFQRILLAFKNARPPSSTRDTSKNNLADTISLLMLIELVRRYNKRASKAVPRFFDSSGLFERAAKDAGVLSNLVIESDEGLKSSALVLANGLVYKAVLFSRDDFGDLLANLRKAVEGREPASDEASRLDNLVRNLVQPLGEQLRHVLDLSFLERIWLKTMAKEELREIANRWISETALTDHFRETIDLTVEASVRDVLSGALEYKSVSETWSALRQDVILWRKKHVEIRLARPGGPDTELGLFRFGPTTETTRRVKEVLDEFADDQWDEGKLTGLRAWHNLFACCMDFERKREGADVSHDAEFMAGTLWALGANARILQFLKTHVKAGTSFFVKTIYIAAMLKLGRTLDLAEEGIAELCDIIRLLDLLNPGTAREDALVEASSVGYLYFHLSRARRAYPPQWRTAALPGLEKERSALASQYHSQAIKYVETACEHARKITSSDDHWRERQMYVANQRLYYLVEQGSPDRIQDIEAAYTELVEYRDNFIGLFRSTYWDTLARYWAFLAFRANNAKSWQSFMDEANSNFAEAVPAGKFESEVNTFGAYLKKATAQGFVPQSQLAAT